MRQAASALRRAPRARLSRAHPTFYREGGTAPGGAPAQGVDFLDRSYGAFPWLVLGVLALTYLVLLRAFRSLVLPLKAVLLNVLSVAVVTVLYAVGTLVMRFLPGIEFPLEKYDVEILLRSRLAWLAVAQLHSVELDSRRALS